MSLLPSLPDVWYHWLFCSAAGKGAVPATLGIPFGRPRSPATAALHMPDERDPFMARSMQHMQENIRRAGPAATASYTLIGAILLLGGIGFWVDRWQETSPWFLFGGLILGIVVGFYGLARAVWKP